MEIFVESIVPSEFSGARLDAYLAARFDYKSRTEWRREIERGMIVFNGVSIQKHHKRLCAGDRVKYEGRSYSEPEVDRNISIIYEDEHIFAVNKSGNLPVHPSGIFFFNTLQTILEEQLSMKVYPLHRLDRETSGVVIFAKNKQAASAVQTNFSADVKKKYIAIVHGTPGTDPFEINIPIGPARNSVIRKKREAYEGAPEMALTRFAQIQTFNAYSLLDVYPETGRQHQIRVHLLAAGHPIVGDKMYGFDETIFLRFLEEGNSSALIELLEMPRCALHSSRLEFTHPVSRERLTIAAPVPADFKNFIKSRGGYVNDPS